MSEVNRDELIVGLFDRGILQFSDFEWKLKSERMSPVYYNQRPITSVDRNIDMPLKQQRRVLSLAVTAFAETIDDGVADHIYGIPQAATHFAGMVAMEARVSSLWGRVGTKDYGKHEAIEGSYADGDKVVQLDDVVTDAGSKLESAQQLEQQGLITAGFVVGLDRQEGGVAAVHQAGYEIDPVIDMSTAVEVLRTNGKIGMRQIDWMKRYHEGLRQDGIHSTFETEV